MITIKAELSPSSIDKAIDEINKYKSRLQDRIQSLVNELVQDGVQVAGILVSSAQGDSKKPDVTYEVNPQGDIVNATIAIVGTDVLFIEFGAGIAYNTGNVHPKASEFGYGPGTYPSKHPPNKAINPGYWYYTDYDNAGKKISKRSIGTEATMPMYHAAETIRNNLIQKAIDNFMRG